MSVNHAPHDLAFSVVPQDGKTRVHAVCLRCASDYAGLFSGPTDAAEAAGKDDAVNELAGVTCQPIDLEAQA